MARTRRAEVAAESGARCAPRRSHCGYRCWRLRTAVHFPLVRAFPVDRGRHLGPFVGHRRDAAPPGVSVNEVVQRTPMILAAVPPGEWSPSSGPISGAYAAISAPALRSRSRFSAGGHLAGTLRLPVGRSFCPAVRAGQQSPPQRRRRRDASSYRGIRRAGVPALATALAGGLIQLRVGAEPRRQHCRQADVATVSVLTVGQRRNQPDPARPPIGRDIRTQVSGEIVDLPLSVTINAAISWPIMSSGNPTTATSITRGWRAMTFSSSCGATLTPPRTMTSDCAVDDRQKSVFVEMPRSPGMPQSGPIVSGSW